MNLSIDTQAQFSHNSRYSYLSMHCLMFNVWGKFLAPADMFIIANESNLGEHMND